MNGRMKGKNEGIENMLRKSEEGKERKRESR
jgi:hypothetical protein